jgi:asparagine N-glycosylation enzyme membrane subunit Stt3
MFINTSSIEYIPIILAPTLVIVVYFVTRELIPNNDIAALLASFLTAVSSHTLIGIYAGFYANWLALTIGYLSFVFLTASVK